MKNKTRQARSIARIRAARRAQKKCIECGARAAVRKVASTGRRKILSRCAACLAAKAAREN